MRWRCKRPEESPPPPPSSCADNGYISEDGVLSAADNAVLGVLYLTSTCVAVRILVVPPNTFAVEDDLVRQRLRVQRPLCIWSSRAFLPVQFAFPSFFSFKFFFLIILFVSTLVGL